MPLTGRRVLVLEEAWGLGWHVARGCLDRGATVTLGTTALDEAQRAMRARPSLVTVAVDFTDDTSVAALLRSHAPIDHVVALPGSTLSPSLELHRVASHILPSLHVRGALVVGCEAEVGKCGVAAIHVAEEAHPRMVNVVIHDERVYLDDVADIIISVLGWRGLSGRVIRLEA
ncbi:MAG: hypothetical protein AAGA48_37015 [Myxococcota bacterium]